MADWDVISSEPWGVVSHEPVKSPVENVGAIAAQVPQGINEALYRAATALPDLSSWISKKVGMVPETTPYPSDALRGSLKIAEVGRAPETKSERVANSIGQGVGDVFGTLAPGGLLARAKSLGPLAQSVGRAVTASPVQQGAYTAAGAAAGEAAENPYVGAATSLALPLLTHGAQRTFSAAPAASTQEAERRALLEEGRKIGAPLTAGKITDSKKLQTVESWMDKTPIPLLGGRVAATEEANRDAWQTAILKKAGIEGESAATSNVTDKAFNRLSQRFEDLTKGSTLNVTPEFGTKLGQIKAEYGERLFEDVQPGLMRRIDELAKAPAALNGAGNPSVTLDGRAYQNIRSDLSRISGTASKPADRRAAGMMVTALDDMAESSLPKDVMKDWTKARQEWRNLLAIKGAVGGANNPETAVGNIPTAAFGRRAQGNPDLERLGQYGNAFVGDKMSNTSRTAHHSAVPHILGGAAALYEGLQHAPQATMYGALAGSIPFALDHAMNNPLTRALLLSRYRNPSAPIASPALYGSLAGQQGLEQAK